MRGHTGKIIGVAALGGLLMVGLVFARGGNGKGQGRGQGRGNSVASEQGQSGCGQQQAAVQQGGCSRCGDGAASLTCPRGNGKGCGKFRKNGTCEHLQQMQQQGKGCGKSGVQPGGRGRGQGSGGGGNSGGGCSHR